VIVHLKLSDKLVKTNWSKHWNSV